MRSLWLAAVLFISSFGVAQAACTVPVTLANGTLADADQVMQNFNAVAGCVDGVLPILDARSYGVLADGSTSDDVALRTAVAACSASAGKTLLLPQGRIKLTGAASIALKNCNVVGQGVANSDAINRGTTFLLTSTTVKPFILGGNCAMRGINFYWPNQTGAVVYPALFSDDGVTDISQCNFDNLVVLNAYNIFAQTVGRSWNTFNVTNSYFYAVNAGFKIGKMGDSWRMSNVHFTPGPWLILCSFTCDAAVNTAAATNAAFDIIENATMFITNMSGFAWRYGFLIEAAGSLTNSDIEMAMDGTGTLVDSSSGGITTGTAFRGAGNNCFIAVYTGFSPAATGTAPCFNIGATGDITLNDIEIGQARGSVIETAGASVLANNISANYAQAGGTDFYVAFVAGHPQRVDITGSTFFGQADAHSRGIVSTNMPDVFRIHGSGFWNVDDAIAVATTAGRTVEIENNYSVSTFGTASVVITGTGPVFYSANRFDKPPRATVESCGTGAAISIGAQEGIIQVGSPGPVTSCTLDLPWVFAGGANGICTAMSTVSTLQVAGITGSPPKWTFGSTGAVDIAGAQIFFRCSPPQ